ncbi:MAG: glycoside hydrolase family 127 protein [Steroidobacteraceae bacterium]
MVTISRRQLIQLGAALAASSRAAARGDAPQAPRNLPRPPEPVVAEQVAERYKSLPFEAQQLGGLFAERMRVNVEGRLLHIDQQAFVSPFVHRDSTGHFDAAWVGEHAGKFLDAACNALRYHDHPQLRRIADRVSKALVASQEPDGYLGTYAATRRWAGWDVWVHKYNLIGLLSYYELSADPAILRACRAIGDLLASTFGDGPGQRDIVSAGEHIGMAATSVLEPMCKLYRFSGNIRHLEFCKYVVRAYEQPHGPHIVSSLLRTASVYRTANAKAYEMLSNFNGLVDLYRLTADQNLLDAVLRAWDDIVQHQLYRTGTVSAMEHFQPDGRLLSLQSSNVGETCATVTWLQLNWRLLRLTGQARFGQEIERTVYNHLLAAQDRKNGDISYYTSWVGEKEFTAAVLCCVSSGPRGISLIPQLVWGLQKDALVINLYTPGRAHFEIGGIPLEVTSETTFPADGHVMLTVSTKRAIQFTVRLRVPEWVTTFEVRTGSRTLSGTPGQMLDISQTWQGSSTLNIHMDMPTRVWSGAPTYPDYVSIQRGPQVLALEQSLNPTVPYLHRTALGDSPKTAVRKAATIAAGWSGDQLYEVDGIVGLPGDTDQLRFEQRTLRLVPFADAHASSVWLTRAGVERRDRPAVTAFARTSLSVLSLALEPTEGKPVATDIAEFVTDENPNTYCTVNPQDPGLANYLGAPPGKRGDPVWFTVRLRSPATISRVVFRHGAVSATGGWFDTTEGVPRIEVAVMPIPTSSNGALADDSKATWELAALLERYPRTTASAVPALVNGQLFEVRLQRPVLAYGIRVVGRPAGDHASCAELSAYT